MKTNVRKMTCTRIFIATFFTNRSNPNVHLEKMYPKQIMYRNTVGDDTAVKGMNYLYMQQHKQILRYAEQKKLDRKEFILLWSSSCEVLEQATLINVVEVEEVVVSFHGFSGERENRLERVRQPSRVVEMLIFVLSSGYTEYTMIRTHLNHFLRIYTLL